MNFCKECDEYISLYIDELLDDKTKSEFLKHMNICSHCSAKFEEALYCAELCKAEKDIELPENFTQELHRRLQEVSQGSDKNNKQGKLMLIIKNKRLIASLSTAAVLVISLLAYNLMPNMVSKNASTANYSEASQIENIEASDKTGNYFGKSEVEKNTENQGSKDSKVSSKKVTEESATGVISEEKDIKLTFSEPLQTEKKENDVIDNNPQMRTFQVEEGVGTDSGTQDTQQENDAFLYSLSGNKFDTAKHISNYAEIKMEVSEQRTEIEQLKLLMKEIGASELHTVFDNKLNSAESSDKADLNASIYESATSFVVASEYVDYYLPLNQYSRLEAMAEKYHMEFSSKTDIIKKDISEIYNELNKKKEEIDNKITEASKNKEDTSAYEAEKERLTEEMNKIIDEKEIVVVRVFFLFS